MAEFNKQIKTIILLASFGIAPASAADWGYEEPQRTQELQAPARAAIGSSAVKKNMPAKTKPAPSLFYRPTPSTQTTATNKAIAPAKTAPIKSTATKAELPKTKPAAKTIAVTKNEMAAKCWLQLLDFVIGKKLTEEQQKRFLDYLMQIPSSQPTKVSELTAILAFWPKTVEYLQLHDHQQENYRQLFRALLRLNESTLKNSGGPQGGMDILAELLGPARVAVPGNPDFTEDAVNAYCDMACFLYEQEHPDKTIDAADNRAVFATVIKEKFKDAPTAADKKAMANFDLLWHKFKINYDDASVPNKQIMVKQLMKSTNAGNNNTNPILDLILKHWPSHMP